MDKQNQGIGAYKDRPGYFLGGMVGGAILGALVNKIQGKDMRRGAIFGGITGGLGSAFLGSGAGATMAGNMKEGVMKSLLTAATKNKGAAALAGIGLGTGAAYMADDPAFLKRKREEEMARLEEEQRRRNKELYANWYTNPFDNFNDGGEVMVEETQIASAPHPMEGWYDMYDDMINSGEFKGTFEEFLEMINNSDYDVPMAARGGRIHAKDGLWANIHAKRKRIKEGSGEKMRSPGSPGAPTAKALRDSKAGGGISDLDMRLGGASNGPGTGTSDDIPAMLSDGEFVVTAKAVENLGGGDRMLGAQRMYNMMNQLDPNSQTPAEMTTVGYA